MKIPVGMIVSAFFLVLTANAYGTCPSDNHPRLRDYDGVIGENYRVKVALAVVDGKVDGTYFYTTQLKDIAIKGNIVDGKKLVLDEIDSAGQNTGYFEGEFAEQDPLGKFGTSKLQCEVITDNWHSQDNPLKKLPFYLALQSESDSKLNHRYQIAGAEDDQHINQIAQHFWESVKLGNKNEVASLIAYPITVKLLKGSKRIRNALEFLKYYDAIFTVQFVQAIANATPRNMFARDQGIMLGNGEVWFGANGKVISLNNQQ